MVSKGVLATPWLVSGHKRSAGCNSGVYGGKAELDPIWEFHVETFAVPSMDQLLDPPTAEPDHARYFQRRHSAQRPPRAVFRVT